MFVSTQPASITADVDPTNLFFAPGETKSLAVTVDTTGAEVGDYGGMVWLVTMLTLKIMLV